MIGSYKNFVIFNANQKNAEVAGNEIYETGLAGSPRVVGNHVMVTFSTNCKSKTAEEIYDIELKNCKEILDKHKVKYKIRKFKG